MKRVSGLIMSNVSAALLLFIFLTCIVVYTVLWIKIRRANIKVQSQSGSHSKKSKFLRTGQVMMLFVIAFVMQWWPWATQGVMSYVSPDLPSWIIFAAVSLCNMGGTLNAIVYTVMRKRFLQKF